MIGSHLHEVKPAVAAYDLFVRKIVVHVGRVDLQNFVAQKRKRLQRVDRVQHQEAAQIHVFLDGGPGLVQRFRRVIAQQHAQLRIVAGAPASIQLAEPVQPQAAARAGSHADLEEENLRRQLVLGFQLAQQRPEIADGVGDRLRLMPVRDAARKRLLVAFARRRFPLLQTIPVERVELPDDAVAERSKLLERQPVLAFAEPFSG